MGNKIFHIELKSDNSHKYFGSLSALFKHNENLGISKFSLDRHNFETPFENEMCVIRKSQIVKSKRNGSNEA